jgi:hypothetical protein
LNGPSADFQRCEYLNVEDLFLIIAVCLLQDISRQLSERKPDVDRLMDEGNSLAKLAASTRISASAQQLQSRYQALATQVKVAYSLSSLTSDYHCKFKKKTI